MIKVQKQAGRSITGRSSRNRIWYAGELDKNTQDNLACKTKPDDNKQRVCGTRDRTFTCGGFWSFITSTSSNKAFICIK